MSTRTKLKKRMRILASMPAINLTNQTNCHLSGTTTDPSIKTSLEMSCSRKLGIINQVSNLTFKPSNNWRKGLGVKYLSDTLLFQVIMSKINNNLMMSTPKRDF
jgi:hypothetical protein